MSNLLTVFEMFLFFSSFLFFVVGLFWFSLFLQVCCIFSLFFSSIHFSSFFSCLIRSVSFLLLFFFSFFYQIYSSFFSSIGQHLYRPFPWSSRFKLMFDTTPCGHELAFGTGSYMLYRHIHLQSENIIKNNDERNTLVYKNMYLSHFILERVDVLLRVRDEWRQGQTAILTQLLLLIIAALLPHLGWGCSTGGRWGPQHSVCKLALFLAFLLQLTQLPPAPAYILS